MGLKSVLHDILDVLEGAAKKSIPDIRSKVEQLGSEEIERVLRVASESESPVAAPEVNANPAGGIPVGGLHPDASAAVTPVAEPEPDVSEPDDVTVTDTDPETDRGTVDEFVSSATPEQLSSLAAFIGANYPPESA